MNSLRGGPFRFGELKGTRWYHRFVAEEFYLVFDQLPKKSIVIDRCIDHAVDRRVGIKEPTMVEEYRRQLLDYFFYSSDIDTITPARILLDLRRLRETVLGESLPGGYFCSFNAAQTMEEAVQIGRPNNIHGSLQSKVQALYPGNAVYVMSGFEEALQGAKRILFIPGSPHRFAAELEMLLQHSVAEIEIACTMDYTATGVTSEQAEQILSAFSLDGRELNITEAFPFVLGKSDINVLAEKSNRQLIFISNIWTYLQVFRGLGRFCFLIDNSEWFSRGLFQNAYDTDGSDQASPLCESSYKEMLRPSEPKSGHTVAAFQEFPFPSQVDVSGVQYNSLSLYKFLKGEPAENLSDRLQRQQKQLQDIGWPQVVNGYVSINEERVQPSVAGVEGAVLVSAVAAQEKSVKFRPALLTQRASICPEAVNGEALCTSFNYYFTENLRSLYNQQVPSAQQIPYMDLLIDYIGMRLPGLWHETLPLYQKAMLGAGSAGELCAGYYPLQQAALTITALDETWEHRLVFSLAQINPPNGGPGLYLPSYHELWVGRGFQCLVLVQDQPVCLQPGPCRIPPLGSVVVLREKLSFDKASFRWDVSLDGLPLPKEKLEWLVGGFNLLVDNGRNLYPSPHEGLLSLEREGWHKTQSTETQETQLDPFVQQPRSMLGKAVSGKVLLISIAGRTSSSKGATFTEAVQIAQYLLGEDDAFQFLINFDGGASASITAAYQEECEALGLTAPSLSNPAGVARQLKSYLILEKNTEQESL